MAQVSLERLRKVYPNGHVAVHEASFEVGDGELLVLVGPSGCGKSTLLRMIAGLEAISDGELRIGGTRVNELSPKDRDIAMVFQNYALYPHMTVAENLGFGLKLRGMPKQDVQRRVGEAAEMLEIAPLLQRRPAALSGGQRQRVALGRALVRQPRVFLLDEPLSNLDAKLRAGMRVEIARLQRQIGTTMIYVTHDQVEAMTLGQRIVVLRDGRIQQIDTPMALYERPANLFVAGFLGSPAMNLIEGDWVAAGEGGQLRIAADMALVLADAPAVPAGRVTLGVRPEDLTLAEAGAGTLPARVEVVEAVGSEAFLNLDCGGRALVVRVPPRDLPRVGDRVHWRPLPERLHFFDPASGDRLPS
ncbi:ABC transporter ATP-binding protein [Marilutibacter maris]|uniref:Glycerol-3-phosphate transporter ATP-binding subunit n=1 Tax=Marilutibacter maris TaxID=1605891 RepID=A0A2U9T389_9GAMM|nr:sn-glycerol-3-phosphate ABC transporter ATP-binding protein UgpC [Lysobacter maris]AWV07146.1 glycerol-3-phosphate transporter ATP-binding subunit [Lysobacter maris]KAB8163147.1 sn-glycerol-3-phosphate ABC transporter ATP-binding protein UgpC [Lysobacter maris]